MTLRLFTMQSPRSMTLPSQFKRYSPRAIAVAVAVACLPGWGSAQTVCDICPANSDLKLEWSDMNCPVGTKGRFAFDTSNSSVTIESNGGVGAGTLRYGGVLCIPIEDGKVSASPGGFSLAHLNGFPAIGTTEEDACIGPGIGPVIKPARLYYDWALPPLMDDPYTHDLTAPGQVSSQHDEGYDKQSVNLSIELPLGENYRLLRLGVRATDHHGDKGTACFDTAAEWLGRFYGVIVAFRKGGGEPTEELQRGAETTVTQIARATAVGVDLCGSDDPTKEFYVRKSLTWQEVWLKPHLVTAWSACGSQASVAPSSDCVTTGWAEESADTVSANLGIVAAISTALGLAPGGGYSFTDAVSTSWSYSHYFTFGGLTYLRERVQIYQKERIYHYKVEWFCLNPSQVITDDSGELVIPDGAAGYLANHKIYSFRTSFVTHTTERECCPNP